MAYYSDTTEEGAILTGKYPDLQVGDDADDDVTQAQLDDAALAAYSYINSTLAKVYPVPFDTTTPPGAIVQISDNLTIAGAKASSSGHSLAVKGPWTARFEFAEKWLEDLRTGKKTMPEVTRRPSGLYISTEGEHPAFGLLDDTFDMGQDPDQAERIADERD